MQLARFVFVQGVAMAIVACALPDAELDAIDRAEQSVSDARIPPRADAWIDAVEGVDGAGVRTNGLWNLVDEATPDWNRTIVRSAAGSATAHYTARFDPSGISGRATSVTVRYTAHVGTASSGTVRVDLIDVDPATGAKTVVGTGPERTLVRKWRSWSDTYKTDVASVDRIRARVTFSNTGAVAAGSLKLTSLDLEVTTGSAGSAGSASIVSDVAGDDWHLPQGVVPAARSGIYGAGPAQLNDVVTVQMPNVPWSQMHMGDGKFDWSAIDKKLAQSPIVLRMWCGSPSQVPLFVRNRHSGWRTFVNSEGDVELPQWSSAGWIDEWKPFVTALAARYKDNPRFLGFQLQVTADGESFMSPSDVQAFENLGLTPSVMKSFLTAYYGHAVSAFSGAEWKVFSVMHPKFFNSGTRFTPADYDRAVRDATLPALDRGMGLRGSGISERFTFPADWTDWAELNGGMLVVHDDTFAPFATGAHRDGQLENWYGPNQSPQVTTNDAGRIRYAIRMSLLRALAEQDSFVWVDSEDADFVELGYPGIVHWARSILGRSPADSPDAFLVLGSWPYRNGVVTNAWPRWVRPLDLASTTDGVAVDVSGLGIVSGPQYLGRSFSVPLGLAVDDRFLAPGGSHDVELLIEYLDDGSSWHVTYDATAGTRNAPGVKTGTTRGWRTTTIHLPDATFAGRLADGADLRIVPDAGTPTVQSVRIARR